MQIPKRRYDKNDSGAGDYHISANKAAEYKQELERLKKVIRPRQSEEVAEHAKLGDFSENAAYQIAKGKLRGTNHRILVLDDILNNAIIIPECGTGDCVQIGSKVTVKFNGRQKVFQILGSQETNPAQGIISHLSPIGAALIGHKKNDEVNIEINNKPVKYQIIKIE
ncbi:MAG: GreA/GreB family elongation factor [Candidatus Parcubacteria bacterium]|nr:GreA/GreB family elongation factor [Candidatus Parcubacteria bacterium]